MHLNIEHIYMYTSIDEIYNVDANLDISEEAAVVERIV